MTARSIYRKVRSDRAGLPEQIARQILDLITARELRVGDCLPPLDELTKQLRVSRTALREGIKLLEAWGVITVRHGVGTFVSGLDEDTLTIPFKLSAVHSEQSIGNLHQVREALEPAIAALAAENAGPEDIEKMEEGLHRMQQLQANPDEYIEADLAFHSALASASGNDLFLVVIRPVIDLLQEARRLSVETPGAAERAQAFHEMILKHVKAGNADGAREAMQSHLDQTWWEIERQMHE